MRRAVLLLVSIATLASCATLYGCGRSTPPPEDVANRGGTEQTKSAQPNTAGSSGIERRGSEVSVGSGEAPDGTRWRLTAFRSNAGLCIGLWASGLGEGGSCGFAVRGAPGVQGGHSIAFAGSADPEGVDFIYGPAAASVERVAVTLADGKVLDLRATPAPEALGANLRFYGAAYQGAPAERVAAKNAEGEIVEEREVQ